MVLDSFNERKTVDDFWPEDDLEFDYDISSYLDNGDDYFDYDEDSDYEKYRDRNWDLMI
jgi:hypothetical protein